MIGILAIAIFLVVALVVVAALGFVFLCIVSAMITVLARGAPLFGRVACSAGVAIAAVILAISTIDFAQEQAQKNPQVFAFVQQIDGSGDQTTAEDSVAEHPPILAPAGESVQAPAENPDIDVVGKSGPAPSVDANLPNWVTQGLAARDKANNTADQETHYIVLKSDLKVLREEADEQIREQAAEFIRRDFSSHYAAEVEWELPAQVVEDAIRRSYYTTENVALTPTRDQEMHRVYAQMALSPSLRNAIYPGWRKLVASRRLVKLGQGFGLMSLLIVSMAMFLRYDKQTLGQKRGRLGMMSLAMLAGGSVVLGAVGESIRSKLSAANIVESEYCRDRVDQLDETVIGLNEGPVFEADAAASKIAIVIDGATFHQAGLIRRQMADYIESLSPDTKVEIHIATDRQQATVGFQGGANAQDVRKALEEFMSRQAGNSASVSNVLESAIRSDAQSVFMVTEDLARLTDRERRRVKTLAVRSNLVPISFIKVFDGKPTRLDESLQALASRSGGYLRLLDALDLRDK